MLAHLRIENLALIDELELSFTRGFNVLTGETGAGKSIAIGALGLVLGRRANAGLVRQGCPHARVEALFSLEGSVRTRTDAALAKAELPLCDDGELLVRRVISAQGKSRQYINGAAVTVAQLNTLSRPLVDVTSQHAHQALTAPGRERALLDAFGQHGALLDDVSAHYDAALAAAEAEAAIALDEAEKAQRLDWLSYQLDEIEALDPQEGEDETLKQEIDRLKSADQLGDALVGATTALDGDGEGAVTWVQRAAVALGPLAQKDPTLQSVAARLEEAAVLIEDATHDLHRAAASFTKDPARLDALVDRQHTLRKVMTKHGGSLEAVFRAQSRLGDEREALEHQETLLAERAAERAARCRALEQSAALLSAARTESKGRLVKAIEKELKDLHMSGARIDMVFSPAGEEHRLNGCNVSRHGAERAHFELQANVGERPGPLSKTASGGELSRVVLAIKRVLLKSDPTPLSLFDEVDAGVGGVVADAIADKLQAIARGRQVICITHLAQIAAKADTHFVVQKFVEDARTKTNIGEVKAGSRTAEVARMMAGKHVTPEVLMHAEKMCHASTSPGSADGATSTKAAPPAPAVSADASAKVAGRKRKVASGAAQAPTAGHTEPSTTTKKNAARRAKPKAPPKTEPARKTKSTAATKRTPAAKKTAQNKAARLKVAVRNEKVADASKVKAKKQSATAKAAAGKKKRSPKKAHDASAQTVLVKTPQSEVTPLGKKPSQPRKAAKVQPGNERKKTGDADAKPKRVNKRPTASPPKTRRKAA